MRTRIAVSALSMGAVVAMFVASPAPAGTAAAAAVDCAVIGGGTGYSGRVVVPSGTKESTVSTLTQLKDALKAGAKYIRIPGTAVIDIPNQAGALSIPDSVKIYSDRGIGGSPGGLLRVAQGTGSTSNSWAVIQVGSGVRFSALRMQGPSSSITAKSYIIGIQARNTSDNIEVDNSELWGFTWSPVSLSTGSTNNKVHHNYIHGNQRAERGYGVVVQSGSTAKIWCNAFDANRHAIAGSGENGDGYEAYGNLVLGVGNGHAFDMHEGSGGNGGKYVSIHDNWVAFKPSPFYASVKVRGVPSDGRASIINNHFAADQVDGSNYAAVQGPGVASGATLRQQNMFKASISVADDGKATCALKVNGSVTARVNCDVLG